MEGQVKCKKTLVEDGVTLFLEGKIYESIRNNDGTLDGRSEIDQYVTISSSGAFKFEDFFNIVNTESQITEGIVFRDTFEPTGEDYMQYKGMKFEIIRELKAGEEYDKENENHRMYLIKLENGKEIHAFEDEVEVFESE